MSEKNGNAWVVFARYLSLAMLLPVSTVAGYALGYGLDHLFSTQFLRSVFLLIGAAAGFIQLVRGLTKE